MVHPVEGSMMCVAVLKKATFVLVICAATDSSGWLFIVDDESKGVKS